MERDDTICAISTPVGEGGIGVIRMSGHLARQILNEIFKPKKDRKAFRPRLLYLGHIINPENGAIIDEVLAVFMAAPNTYTKEDVAEVYSHGGYATQKTILALMMEHGARLADPGEFTKRAFLNGRIDLMQAESVLDVIQSETAEELKNAVEHLEGGLSQKINSIKEHIKEALVETEAAIDFPEDEVGVEENKILSKLKKATRQVQALIDSYYGGKAVKHGLEVLIVGKPNVGKSSLLNALLLKEKAIVTPAPGTTRDLIEDILHIKGIKVKIVDTAGLRKPRNAVEREGIERVRQRIPGTDLIIWVLDSSDEYASEDESIYEQIRHTQKLAVINKTDLPRKFDRRVLKSRNIGWVEISALKETGLERLKDEMHTKLMEKGFKKGGILITSMRQRDALKRAMDALKRAIACIKTHEPLEFAAFELHEALSGLGEITGETCPDEILQGIFEKFCIGK